jgi:steroid delta-isomerase-like uncharacterized protein
MTREEIAVLIDRWQHARDRHDVAALADLYAQDCVVDSPLGAGTVRGRDNNLRVYRAFWEAFPDSTLAVDQVLIDGDRVVEIGTLTGTDTGGLMGMGPSGKPFVIPIVWFFKVANNQIVYDRRIYDFTGLLVQIGVLKAKPA